MHRSSPNWVCTKGSDHLQLIKFWPSCAPRKGVCGGAKIFGSALLQPAYSVCISLSAFYSFYRANICTHRHTQIHRDNVIAISALPYYLIHLLPSYLLLLSSSRGNYFNLICTSEFSLWFISLICWWTRQYGNAQQLTIIARWWFVTNLYVCLSVTVFTCFILEWTLQFWARPPLQPNG